VADEARGAARDVMAEARRTGSALKSEATGLVGEVRQQLASQVESQKDGLADRIAAVAQQVYGTAEDLRGREAWLADLVDRGARQLDEFAADLKHRDVRSVVGGVETLAHRHPALFVGTAVAVGFALTRMIRGGASDVRGEYGRSYRGDTSQTYGTEGRGYGAVGAYVDEGDASHPDLATRTSRGTGFEAATTTAAGSVSTPAGAGTVTGGPSVPGGAVRGSNV
jgi:hypothetical protein